VRKQKNFLKEDRKFVEQLVGRNVDLLNIEWIYRGLKFYNTLPEELINYALNGGLEFKYEDLKKLCYSDVDNLIKTVQKTPYKELFNPDKDIDTFLKIRIQKYLYNMFKDVFKKAKMDISVSIGYLHLLEFEIRDVMTILESKRYQMSSIDIREYLIRDLKGSE
jgi:Archaeal/vacuolar-type H+-ATPase subunit C